MNYLGIRLRAIAIGCLLLRAIALLVAIAMLGVQIGVDVAIAIGIAMTVVGIAVVGAEAVDIDGRGAVRALNLTSKKI